MAPSLRDLNTADLETVYAELTRSGLVQRLIQIAHEEDLGPPPPRGNGDITSYATLGEGAEIGEAALVVREGGVLAGLRVLPDLLRLFAPNVELRVRAADGHRAEAETVAAALVGPFEEILAAERTLLNIVGRLSGVATMTRRFVDAVAGTRAKIYDTRKTTPGLRVLEKYAVRCGGGMCHRIGLYDAVLIKDNHIAVAGGVRIAIERARAAVGHLVKIEVEVDTLEQLEQAMDVGVDAVLLDNMGPDMLRRAVEIVGGRALTEASGRITPQTAPAVAASGVDLISVGWLTHSAAVLDIGLDHRG